MGLGKDVCGGNPRPNTSCPVSGPTVGSGNWGYRDNDTGIMTKRGFSKSRHWAQVSRTGWNYRGFWWMAVRWTQEARL